MYIERDAKGESYQIRGCGKSVTTGLAALPLSLSIAVNGAFNVLPYRALSLTLSFSLFLVYLFFLFPPHPCVCIRTPTDVRIYLALTRCYFFLSFPRHCAA